MATGERVEWTTDNLHRAAGEFWDVSDQINATLNETDWLGGSIFGTDSVGTTVHTMYLNIAGPMIDDLAATSQKLDDHAGTLKYQAQRQVSTEDATTAETVD